MARKKSDVVPVDALAAAKDPQNARRHGKENQQAIANSFRAFGAGRSIVMDADGVIRAGNGSVDGAAAAGIQNARIIETDGSELIVVKRTDLSGERAVAYGIADNRTGDLSDWDPAALEAAMSQVTVDDFRDATGFTDEALRHLLPVLPPDSAVEDLDQIPDAPSEPVTKPGDLWVLGNHRLLCGDSTSKEDVSRLMDGRKADLCFTSPPYGAGNTAKLRDHYVPGAEIRESFYDQHDDDPDSWPSLMAGWFDAFRPVCECIVCNVQMLADNKRPLVRWVAERIDDLCDVIVWDKCGAAPQMQANVLSNAFEFLFVFGGNASRAIPFAKFHGTLSNVIRIDPRGKNKYSDLHRAVFPLELPMWAMKSLCSESRSVADPFCGSGTTLIAAERLGRQFFGMELSPAYCDVTVKRWEWYTGRKAELES